MSQGVDAANTPDRNRTEGLDSSCRLLGRAGIAFLSPRPRKGCGLSVLCTTKASQAGRRELRQLVLDLHQQFIERGVTRHLSIYVSGEAYGGQLRVTITGNLLRRRQCLEHQGIDGVPIGRNAA